MAHTISCSLLFSIIVNHFKIYKNFICDFFQGACVKVGSVAKCPQGMEVLPNSKGQGSS